MNYKWESRIKWDDIRDKRILIAGGTGFIGQRVVKFFEKHEIHSTVLTRKERKGSCFTEYKRCDLCNVSSLKAIAEEYDILLYLAANIPLRGQKKENYLDALESTLVPFVNFASTFVRESTKLIYVSTVDILGNCNVHEFTEEEMPGVATPYGLAKYCGEYYARDICTINRAECIILRFAQVYGPDEPIVRVIPIIKEAILNDKEFNIWTDGEEKRRFLYVDDAVQSVLICMNCVQNGTYNIAGKDIVSIKQLMEIMIEVFEKDFKYGVLNRVSGMDNVPSFSKAFNKLGFIPEVCLKDGLRTIKGEQL